MSTPNSFLRRVVIQDIDVQLALRRQSRHRQIAAAQVADDGVDRVGTEQQVQLGVQRVAEEQLDAHLVRLDLRRQTAQPSLVCICRATRHQLVAEFLG